MQEEIRAQRAGIAGLSHDVRKQTLLGNRREKQKQVMVRGSRQKVQQFLRAAPVMTFTFICVPISLIAPLIRASAEEDPRTAGRDH